MKKYRRTVLFLSPVVFVAVIFIIGSIPEGPVIITPPPADAAPGRWVHVEGVANTRDAGGYATRTGRQVRSKMIYRSGKLNRLSADGAETWRELGVTTVIDFCNRLTPWPLFGGDAWSVQLASSVEGCPMSFSKDGPREVFYINGVRDNQGSFRAAFELLSDAENYPVLYHCAAGTDRTGVMSALLLDLLGVPRETILADFRLSEQVDRPGSLPAMKALLAHVDDQGGIERYLASIGVDAEMQARIREILLVDGPQ